MSRHARLETVVDMTDSIPCAPLILPKLQRLLHGTHATAHVGLVGYLSGDVNGSFAGVPGAQDLDLTQPGYFTQLVSLHPELTAAQFGWV